MSLAAPSISAVSVDGGSNQPGSDADAEVMLDIEIAGALAPAAKFLVCFAPNTDQGFYNAIAQAAHWSVARARWSAAPAPSRHCGPR